MTKEQREILYHTEHHAAGGYYCGGGKDMDALVAAGLMRSAGRKSFVPDEYFCITSAGRNALRTPDSQETQIYKDHMDDLRHDVAMDEREEAEGEEE